VSSSACTSCHSTNHYVSSNSSTYTCQGVEFTSSSRLSRSRGDLSIDTIYPLSNPSTAVKNVIFGEIQEIEMHLPWSPDKWDGVVGLAPSGEMAILENMVNQNILDSNVFALKLPRGNSDRGEILFGDVDHDLYVGELKSLPLLEETNGRWAVAAMSLGVNDGEGLELNLGGTIAVFETEFPFIGLPGELVKILDAQLGMDNAGKGWEHLRSIDCSKRKLLHNITITLGGEEFVLSPWEYTIETDAGGFSEGRRCASAFVPNEIGQGSNIVLGSAFLRAFYGVFDVDRRTVSCEYSPLLFSSFSRGY
jgi:saccharopepsin